MTVPHAPPEAMQFGGALPRLLYLARHQNPKFDLLKGSKHDVKDGFYRMFLNLKDCLRLSLVLPKYEGEDQLTAVPMSCTMGWVQSPPTFCTVSETVCDRANEHSGTASAPDHRLAAQAGAEDDYDRSLSPRPRSEEDLQADARLAEVAGSWPVDGPEPPPPAPSNRPLQKPLAVTDVFVDEFI